LLADVYEQIGYQKESQSVRNSFLAGAYELRHGIPKGASPTDSGPDMIRAMSTDLWLDYLGIRMDADKAEGTLISPSVNLSALHTYACILNTTADATITAILSKSLMTPSYSMRMCTPLL